MIIGDSASGFGNRIIENRMIDNQHPTGAILDRSAAVQAICPPAAFQNAFWVFMLTAGICLALPLIFKGPLARRTSQQCGVMYRAGKRGD
jgi:hypothetical protein